MAKPKSQPQLSLTSAHLYDDAPGIPAEHWSRLFFEHVFSAFDDAQFADLYEEGGRYPISPSFLACLTLLQRMFGVSDRAAVENTIMRRDWRVALGITHDYDGFDASVLTRFRQRLQAHGCERTIFETTLARIEALGLLAHRRRLRVDATHLVADVARLNEAEAVQEAIRLVVVEAYECYSELRESFEFRLLYEAYAEERWIGGSHYDDERMLTLGRAGYRLLALLGERETERKAVLAALLAQCFVPLPEGDWRPRGPDDPTPDHRIHTPHDPQVERGKKGGLEWLGSKMHVVETADSPDERPNVITDVLVTAPRQEDSTVLPEIAQRARFRTPEADVLLADSGYASAANSERSTELGIDLVAPPRPNTRRAKGNLPPEAFAIDFAQQRAICPMGQASVRWAVRRKTVQIHFPPTVCNACRQRTGCTDGHTGRTVAISRHYEQLCRDRARAKTAAFWNLYQSRSAIEATFSELVHSCGLRRSPYRGEAGRTWHALVAAAALNVRRMLRWLATVARTGTGPGGFDSASSISAAVAWTCLCAAQILLQARLGSRHAHHAPIC
jgi:uracil-DNA glycosylase